MTRIKIHISNVKLPFYPPCEVKCGLQNRVSTQPSLQEFSSLEVSEPSVIKQKRPQQTDSTIEKL